MFKHCLFSEENRVRNSTKFTKLHMKSKQTTMTITNKKNSKKETRQQQIYNFKNQNLEPFPDWKETRAPKESNTEANFLGPLPSHLKNYNK